MSYAYVIYMQNSPITGPLAANTPFATSPIPAAETLSFPIISPLPRACLSEGNAETLLRPGY